MCCRIRGVWKFEFGIAAWRHARIQKVSQTSTKFCARPPRVRGCVCARARRRRRGRRAVARHRPVPHARALLPQARKNSSEWCPSCSPSRTTGARSPRGSRTSRARPPSTNGAKAVLSGRGRAETRAAFPPTHRVAPADLSSLVVVAPRALAALRTRSARATLSSRPSACSLGPFAS